MTRSTRSVGITVISVLASGFLALSVSAGMCLAQAESKFVFANTSPYDTLDPHVVMDVARVAPRINLYDGLMRWVDNPAKLEPWLAENYTVSPDGLSYAFKLRRGARFHDGTEIKASDVVYSMERILALKRGPSSLFSTFVAPGSTKATDEATVTFNLTRPSSIFLLLLPELNVVNAALLKKNEINNDWGGAWLSKNEAGSGSYSLKRYDPAIGFSAERFKDHWNPTWGARPIEEIEFRTILEINSRVQGLLNGDFQGSDGFLPADQIQRLKESANVRVVERDSMRLFHALIHNGREPMNDINFRKALAYAFDYDGFIKNTLANSVTRNPTPLPVNMWGAPKGVKGYALDLEKAREHLSKLKAPPREITIGAIAGYQQTVDAASLLQANLAQIGVQAKIVIEPWPLVAAKMRDEKQMYDVLFLWKSAYYPDPNNWIGEMYDCDRFGARNNSWYCNREVDKLLKDALATNDSEVRRKNYEKAATMVMEDVAGLFIYNTKWYAPYSQRISRIRFSPVGDGQDMRWKSLEAESP